MILCYWGGVEGECASYDVWSFDFGESYTEYSATGLPMCFTSFSVGHSSGVMYALSSETNTIFISVDSTETYEPLIPFTYRSSTLCLGADYNEMFIFDRDSIFYSFDGCSTFTERNYYKEQLQLGDTLTSYRIFFVRGWQSREILAYAEYRYPRVPLGTPSPGCFAEFSISTDCGANWRKIVEHDVRAIDETHAIASTSEPFYTQTGSIVTSDENVLLFDIQGKLIKEAKCINLLNYQNGLYILSNGEKSSKILNIK